MNKKLITLMLATIFTGTAFAEVAEVNFAYQTGWAYLPLHVMKDQKLVEKHAKALGVEVKANYKTLGTPAMINDAMNNGDIQAGAVGIPSLITLNDKTKGQYKSYGSIVALPMYLNTTTNYKSICDFKEGDKIALPSIKVSVQAVTLQMAAKQQCGNPFALDKNTISSTHPDGYTSLMSGNIQGHFTSPPFQYIELKDPKVHKMISSYDVLGGKTSFISLVGRESFTKENPKVAQAIAAALQESQSWIQKNHWEATKLYFTVETPKNEDMNDVMKQLTSNEVEFTSVPQGFSKYSNFMNEVGSIKSKPTWKDLTFPYIHDKKGS